MSRRSVLIVASAVVVAAACGAATASSTTTSTSSLVAPWHGSPATVITTGDSHVTRDDGVVPDGVTVFDDELPAVARLDPDLRSALRAAATDAARERVTLHVNSGWRSPEYQVQLLQEAIAEHGSEEEAARWVATPETSAHVAGDAVDIGPAHAAAWLADHGAAHGLCQTYDNEPWHFELRPEAVDDGCPARFADPTADPRMHR